MLVRKELKVKGNQLKIAIGSCHNANTRNNSIFSQVVKYSPDVYVWLGDAVYLDSGNKTCKNISLSTLIVNYWKWKYQNVEKTTEEKYRIFNVTFNDYSKSNDINECRLCVNEEIVPNYRSLG